MSVVTISGFSALISAPMPWNQRTEYRLKYIFFSSEICKRVALIFHQEIILRLFCGSYG